MQYLHRAESHHILEIQPLWEIQLLQTIWAQAQLLQAFRPPVEQRSPVDYHVILQNFPVVHQWSFFLLIQECQLGKANKLKEAELTVKAEMNDACPASDVSKPRAWLR